MDKNSKSKHTERQIKIFEEIGRTNKPNIDKDIIKNILSILVYTLILLTLSVLLVVFVGIQYIVLGILLIFLSIILAVTIVLPKNNKLKELKDKTDYEIGLFYSKHDKRVIGNARVNKQGARITTIAFGVMFILALIMFIGIGGNYEPTTYEDTVEIQGTLRSIQKDSNDNIHIKINESDTDMTISSIYTAQMHFSEIRNNTNVGDSVIVYKEREYTSHDETVYAIVYLEINGVEYLNHDLVILAEEANNNIGLKTFYWYGGVTLTLSIIGLISLFIIIPKKESKEIYDLSLTEEEKQLKLSQLTNDVFFEASNRNIHIRTSPNKNVKIIFYVMTVYMLACAIGLFVMAIDNIFAIIPGFLSVGFSFLMYYAARYTDKSYIELDGVTLRSVENKKIREIYIFDILKVEINQRFITIYDETGKVFAQKTSKTNNMKEISEALSKYGIG